MVFQFNMETPVSAYPDRLSSEHLFSISELQFSLTSHFAFTFLGYPTLPIFLDLVQMTLITYVSPDKCLIDQHLSHKG